MVMENKNKTMKKEILRVENLSKKFPVQKNILTKTSHWIAAASDISFKLSQNETLGYQF